MPYITVDLMTSYGSCNNKAVLKKYIAYSVNLLQYVPNSFATVLFNSNSILVYNITNFVLADKLLSKKSGLMFSIFMVSTNT